MKKIKISGSPHGEAMKSLSQGMEDNSRRLASRDKKSHGKMIGRLILMLLRRKDRRLYILPKTAW